MKKALITIGQSFEIPATVLRETTFCLYLPLLSCRNSVERVVSLKKVGNLLSHDLSAYIFFLFMVMHRAHFRGTVCVCLCWLRCIRPRLVF